MRPALPLLLLLVAACTPAPRAELIPTGRVGRALAGIEDVTAEAFLVPVGANPQTPGFLLTRGDDGVSFAGFIDSGPGSFSLEVVFRGQPSAAPGPVFLGRWTSDVFTVEEGTVAQPVFRMPIDTIGRLEDGGDEDGDGLGLLDEYLWNADPSARDADQDGLDDGMDCHPGDPNVRYAIRQGGNIEDCDGDGVRRPDLPYPGGGNDCDDRSAEISPLVMDACSDPRDLDCNPATCPVDDQTPPELMSVVPAENSVVGCHVPLEVVFTEDDATGVELGVSALLEAGRDTYAAERVSERTWRFPSFNTIAQASASGGLRSGPRTLELRAVDGASNRANLPLSFDFDFRSPTVTSLVPETLGQRRAPFPVVVNADGATLVRLYASPRNADSTYPTDGRATLLDEVSGSTARFMVDPSQLADGQWMLYPVLEDAVGNRLQPFPAALPMPGSPGTGLRVRADYACAMGAADPELPVLVLTVDSTMTALSGSGALLETALNAARDEDPNLSLVSIVGFGVDANGRVDLADATSFTNAWIFGFRDGNRSFSVAWRTPAVTTMVPLIDPRGSGVTAEDPIPNPGQLPDSTEVLALHAREGMCRALGGRDGDAIIYSVVQGVMRVAVSNEEGDFWRALIGSDGSVVEDLDCN